MCREAALFAVLFLIACAVIYIGVIPETFSRIPPCTVAIHVNQKDAPLLEDYFVRPYYKENRLPRLSLLKQLPGNVASSTNPRDIYHTKAFHPKMTEVHKKLVMRYLQLFADIMRRNGLEDQWFFGGGTLLGSLRHQDLIPWDDDADVLVNLAHRGLIKRELAMLYNVGIRHYESGFRDKIYIKIDSNQDLNGTRPVPFRRYGWPYLDVCYFKIKDGKVDELQETHLRHYSYPTTDVYPLLYRPFGDMWVPTPKNALKLLLEMYSGNGDCVENGYLHSIEWRKRKSRTSCGQLTDKYAMVRRCPAIGISVNASTTNTDFVPIVEQLVHRSNHDEAYVVDRQIALYVSASEARAHFDPLSL